MAKIQLPTATLKVEKKDLLKQKDELEKIVNGQEMRRNWGLCAFLVAGVMSLGVQDASARQSLLIVIGIAAAGFMSYVPPEVSNARQELLRVEELLAMFPPDVEQESSQS